MNVQVWSGNSIDDKDYRSIDGCDTMSKLFLKRCKDYASRTAHREKDFGIWNSHSWSDYHDHAQWICLALVKMGLEAGDVVSISVGRQ